MVRLPELILSETAIFPASDSDSIVVLISVSALMSLKAEALPVDSKLHPDKNTLVTNMTAVVTEDRDNKEGACVKHDEYERDETVRIFG